jgi:hypothetical protein
MWGRGKYFLKRALENEKIHFIRKMNDPGNKIALKQTLHILICKNDTIVTVHREQRKIAISWLASRNAAHKIYIAIVFVTCFFFPPNGFSCPFFQPYIKY